MSLSDLNLDSADEVEFVSSDTDIDTATPRQVSHVAARGQPPNTPRAGRRQKTVIVGQHARPSGSRRRFQATDIWTFVDIDPKTHQRECIFCKYGRGFL